MYHRKIAILLNMNASNFNILERKKQWDEKVRGRGDRAEDVSTMGKGVSNLTFT